MSNELLPLEKVNALELFSNEQTLQTLLNGIEHEATDFEPDTETPTGRKEIATQARKVSSAKVVVEKARKALTDDWLNKKRAVDAPGQVARVFLEDLRDRIRQPLTDWEAEEDKAAEAAAIKAKMEADHIEALRVNDFLDRVAEVKRREAEIAEREEAARIEAEAIENERIQKEREAEIKKKADARAIKVAQDRIEQAERAQKDAEEATKQAEADKEQERVDSARREEKARQEATREAEKKAEREADEKERLENERIEKEKAASQKKAHRIRVNKAVCKALIDNGIDKATAEQLVKLVSNYQISKLTIDY